MDLDEREFEMNRAVPPQAVDVLGGSCLKILYPEMHGLCVESKWVS